MCMAAGMRCLCISRCYLKLLTCRLVACLISVLVVDVQAIQKKHGLDDYAKIKDEATYDMVRSSC